MNRRKALFQPPNASGRSRQGAPVRTIHSTAPTNMRLSRPGEPRLRSSPVTRAAMRSHGAPLRIGRSRTPVQRLQKAALNHLRASLGILRGHTA